MSKTPIASQYKTIVYPVPLPGSFTLGVHSTMTPDGFVKIGPTTSPSFSLENYRGFQNINFGDLKQIFLSYALLTLSP